MKRITLSFLALLVIGASACRWTPPDTVARIGGDEIPLEDVSCPDRLPESSEQCLALSRLKMRRILFDRMLDQALVTSAITIPPAMEQQLEQFVEQLAPTRERYAQVMRCHAVAALEQLGETVEAEPDCVTDERQVAQLAESLSIAELRELIETDLVAEMAEAQRMNMRAEMVLRMVRQNLAASDQSEAEFWRDVYASIDPVFYDVDLHMNAAEVITGDRQGFGDGRVKREG